MTTFRSKDPIYDNRPDRDERQSFKAVLLKVCVPILVVFVVILVLRF
jgi:hypothetical protein